MKHAKRTLTLLLTAAMLSTCLLPFTGCKKTSSTEDPFDDAAPSQSDKGSNHDSKTGWTADNPHGEMIMYGKEPQNGILRYGDMLIGTTNYSNLKGYFSFEEPGNAKLICFDPLCRHWPGYESCAAVTNGYFTNEDAGKYPYFEYIDLYESVDAPVIYYCYRRNNLYAISPEECGEREPVYCIERYDLSQGKRYSVLDNVENTIQQACNYGDYVYFVLDVSSGDTQMQKLCRVHKSGTEPQGFDLSELPETIRIIEAVDDSIYYLVNERYIYRCALDLTGSEMVLDMSSVKGKDGSNGVVAGSYSGHLYYFADVEKVWAGEEGDSACEEKCNLYRLPMNDLNQSAEVVVQDMLFGVEYYRFTEETFYYEPCVVKYIDESTDSRVQTSVNLCDGKLFALNLTTGESKMIVENSGMTIFIKYAWDDRVVFSGWAYDVSGLENSGDNGNLLLAYASGEPYKIWCGKYEVGGVTAEYLESLRGQ